ncbi:hypothetical protein ES703_09275 [subsurface metagenome]
MSKIDDKISLAEKKLIEQRTKFEDRKKELGELVKERGRLQASVILDDRKDSNRITQVDKRRNDIRAELEIYPSLISEMEAKIEALKKEKEEEVLRGNLAKQKKAARKVEELSRELGTLLMKANEANIELQKCRSIYLELHKLTGQAVITKPTTLGSQGWLRVLAGTVKAELAGKGRPMPRYPGAAPPI